MWNSVWNLENPLRVYLILKFTSGVKGLKMEGKISEMISAPVVPAHQKQMLTTKKSVKFFDKIVALSIRAVAVLINID